MTSTLIGLWLVDLPDLFHRLGCRANGRSNARIVASVKSIDGTGDACQVPFGIRGCAIEHEGRLQALLDCSKAESLTAAPAKAGHCQFAVAGRQLRHVIGH